jgi:hypothetical protein
MWPLELMHNRLRQKDKVMILRKKQHALYISENV